MEGYLTGGILLLRLKADGESGGKFETVAVGSGKRAFRASTRGRRVLSFTPGAVERQ